MAAALTDDEVADFASRVIKVNHAGEHGAVSIYTAQLWMARLTAPALIPELRQFKADEERHRAIFWAELQRRQRPRCRSYWLCGIGGLALGLLTGALGKRAIAATTVAVERVVLRHLAHQLALLDGREMQAASAIREIVAEERLHHDVSAQHVANDGFWSRILSPIVAASTETVIWIGMRAG